MNAFFLWKINRHFGNVPQKVHRHLILTDIFIWFQNSVTIKYHTHKHLSISIRSIEYLKFCKFICLLTICTICTFWWTCIFETIIFFNHFTVLKYFNMSLKTSKLWFATKFKWKLFVKKYENYWNKNILFLLKIWGIFTSLRK